MACSKRERDAEVTSCLQQFLNNGSTAAGAVVIASYDCPEHGKHVEHCICTRSVDDRDHVRAMIDRMRAYANVLESHYFGLQPAQPITETRGPEN
jgi:hypothetical protein